VAPEEIHPTYVTLIAKRLVDYILSGVNALLKKVSHPRTGGEGARNPSWKAARIATDVPIPVSIAHNLVC
jgi:hypothetical protein